MASRFVIDVEDMTKVAKFLDQAGEDIIQGFRSRMRNVVREVLHDVFDEAYAGLSEEQFPRLYRDHLYDVVENMYVESVGFGSEVGVQFDLNELGTREELERAYHRHAQLRGGGQLEGPYTGQALKNTDENRHVFWEALMRGEDYFDPRSGKKIPARKNAGKWQQTLSEYMEIWGDKAPFWLFLEHGTKYTPNIPPFDVSGEVQARVDAIGNSLWERAWDKATTYINASTGEFLDRGLPTDAYFDPTVGSHGGYRAKSGRFAKRG